jgi:hypothetical protein
MAAGIVNRGGGFAAGNGQSAIGSRESAAAEHVDG